jgi:hypothetical protein
MRAGGTAGSQAEGAIDAVLFSISVNAGSSSDVHSARDPVVLR